MQNLNCYCCSEKLFKNCCQPYLIGQKKAVSAQTLMRSRYSAYATHNSNYILETTHYTTQKNFNQADILEWSITNQWLKLEILNSTETTVEFKAYYKDSDKLIHVHHEFSTFKKENEIWYYVDGKFYN